MQESSSLQGRGGVALLIDADNLSSPESVEEALRRLTELVGPVAIRRAYGSADNLKGLATVMRELAIRPILNDPLTKNTTDMLLAVDALDLWYECAPAVIAIGTGDADFAPLALRLRERGVRLICFSQKTKLSPDIRAYYEQVFIVRSKSAADAPPAPAPKTRAAAAKKTVPRAKAAPKARPTAPVSAPASTPTPAPAATPAQPALAEAVAAILAVVPGLQDGQTVALNDAVKLLHDAKLIGKNGSSIKFFKKYAAHFELSPEIQPTRLRFLAG
jgi:hypothetical protein|nr:NYN domain-containing protein [uncultured Albidiferax sp.]